MNPKHPLVDQVNGLSVVLLLIVLTFIGNSFRDSRIVVIEDDPSNLYIEESTFWGFRNKRYPMELRDAEFGDGSKEWRYKYKGHWMGMRPADSLD